MITIDKILEILKNDHNFREILFHEHYYYNWTQNVTFNALSYDSRQISSDTLFFAKGATFKKE
ncbi:TPA: UDP-N-acetylmuramoyl-L-alanyl-D-glutamate--L-lysine ligase, partial [Streptococcus agalactiae]|nr:UDP-N-acetylmuramoyl-L-alanyl-D-glutamate--L-lysine ligase [Streptococcus agalactiae]